VSGHVRDSHAYSAHETGFDDHHDHDHDHDSVEFSNVPGRGRGHQQVTCARLRSPPGTTDAQESLRGTRVDRDARSHSPAVSTHSTHSILIPPDSECATSLVSTNERRLGYIIKPTTNSTSVSLPRDPVSTLNFTLTTRCSDAPSSRRASRSDPVYVRVSSAKRLNRGV